LMETVLSSDVLQADLRQRGLARARELSWKRSVDGHLEVYERVLGKA